MKKVFTSLVCYVSLFLGYTASAQWSMDPSVNTPICTATNKQVDPRMMEDGKGGAYITWKDYKPANGLPDIYVQRVNAQGVVLWVLNGVAACADSADQSTPAIVSDMRGGAIVAWSDWRSGIERDLYAQRIDSNGNIKWTVGGANITNLSNREHSEKLCSDGKGGVIVAFEKQISGIWDVWAQRLDSNGNKMWGAGGVKLADTSGTRRNHRIQKDRNGGAIISWQDSRNNSNYDVYAQRVNANGTLLWGNNGKPVCKTTGDQINAKIDPDSINNGAFIAWQDTRNSPDYDIYIQHLDSNGNATWPLNGVVVANAAGNQSALDLMSISTTNEVLITWKDNRNGNYDIYAQKFNATGQAQWAANGIVVCNSPAEQRNPNICSDENKGGIIVWEDSTDVKAQRVSGSGQMLWAINGEPVATAVDEQTSPKNVSDGKGGSIFVFQDKRSGVNDIYAHHLFASGSPNALRDVKVDPVCHLYPNPTTGYLNISATQRMKYLEVLDITGKLLQHQAASGLQDHLDVSNLLCGIYLIRIQTEQGTVQTRFAKQ
ncbi:MAG: T9SS type A sorting domain-containing protein [Chitinophagaceae bacterium]|nr:T9SS type A sorting domain-containing protein [Chitinophagaceae bacterium]